MEHTLSHTIALLGRTPVALNVFLRDLPQTWTFQNEGDTSWNVFDVVGHLIHGERTDWMPRAKTILQFGETQPLVPVDRFAHTRDSQDKSLPQLLDEFVQLRSANVAELRGWNLQPLDLAKTGKHPVFGAVTLSQLLATWVTHDLTHLHQISRIMAHQYRVAVGPWEKYLGVLHCNGHSS